MKVAIWSKGCCQTHSLLLLYHAPECPPTLHGKLAMLATGRPMAHWFVEWSSLGARGASITIASPQHRSWLIAGAGGALLCLVRQWCGPTECPAYIRPNRIRPLVCWRLQGKKQVPWLTILLCCFSPLAFTDCNFQSQLCQIDVNLMNWSDRLLHPRLGNLTAKWVYVYACRLYIYAARRQMKMCSIAGGAINTIADMLLNSRQPIGNSFWCMIQFKGENKIAP